MNQLTKIIFLLLSIPVILHNFYLFDYLNFYITGPKTKPITTIQTIENKPKVMLVPLDSRPPCLMFVEKLADVSGIQIILPPKQLLDNYMNPAAYKEIQQWTIDNIQKVDAALISIDMMQYGGLIASRKADKSPEEIANLFTTIEKLAQNASIPLYASSIIPRLLIAEDDTTKLWQYHVMVYATKKDMQDTFGNYQDFKRMQEMISRVPPELIERFNTLYKQNDLFNYKLSQLTQQNKFAQLVVGQDDGQPFGRPNTNRYNIEQYAVEFDIQDKLSTTHGADELSMLQLASYVNTIRQFQPKIKVIYSNNQVPDIIMPFMPISVEETVREKVSAVNGTIIDSLDQADFILYVHCGTKKTSALELTTAAKNIQMLAQYKPLALVDLSYNFKQRETVLGSLLDQQIPLSSLIAYAGWNTTSNSIGTAIAQSTLFLSKKNITTPELLPTLYQKNFEFTIIRILDDWLYQKNVQDSINKILRWQNINPYKLGDNHWKTIQKINSYMYSKQESLFYKNLAKYPFYKDNNSDYYITNWDVQTTLPWERTFEILITIQTTIGQKENPAK